MLCHCLRYHQPCAYLSQSLCFLLLMLLHFLLLLLPPVLLFLFFAESISSFSVLLLPPLLQACSLPSLYSCSSSSFLFFVFIQNMNIMFAALRISFLMSVVSAYLHASTSDRLSQQRHLLYLSAISFTQRQEFGACNS